MLTIVKYPLILLNGIVHFLLAKVESAILYDAVFMFYNTLETLNARNMSVDIDPLPLSCEGEKKYSAGLDIINLMREVKPSRTYEHIKLMHMKTIGEEHNKLHLLFFTEKPF